VDKKIQVKIIHRSFFTVSLFNGSVTCCFHVLTNFRKTTQLVLCNLETYTKQCVLIFEFYLFIVIRIRIINFQTNAPPPMSSLRILQLTFYNNLQNWRSCFHVKQNVALNSLKPTRIASINMLSPGYTLLSATAE